MLKPYVKYYISSKEKAAIGTLLDAVAFQLSGSAPGGAGDGIFHGEAGKALFCFYYADWRHEQSYRQHSNDLLDAIVSRVNPSGDTGYGNGLAGIATLIVHLGGKGFIDPDSEGMLEEIDAFLYRTLCENDRVAIGTADGLTGYGQYFLARARSAPRGSTNTAAAVVNEIIGLLSVPYNTHQELLDVIDFLSAVLPYADNPSKVNRYLAYAVDRMETILLEDLHFQNSGMDFNPLRSACILAVASSRTQDSRYAERSADLISTLHTHHSRSAETACGASYIEGWLLHRRLFELGGDPVAARKAVYYLNKLSTEMSSVISSGRRIHHSVLDGLAGMGLALLTAVDDSATTWLDMYITQPFGI